MNCLRLLRLVEKQKLHILKIPTVQYAAQHPMRFLETQDMWRQKDGLSKRWHLIYKGPMDKALNYMTGYITFSTATVTLASLYYAAFMFEPEDMTKPVLIGDDVVIANSPAECFIYLGAFVALHIAVKIFISKYVLRIYQDGDQYVAVFRGYLFNTIKKHQFNLQEFKKLKPTFVVSLSDSRFGLGKKHCIIMENYFKTPEHFHYLLSKDKKHDPDRDE